MDHLLSLSQAARMVGIPRKVLQSHIQQGDLSVFEGSIRQSELLKIYPDTQTEASGMLEKARRIQEDAVNKYMPDSMPNPEHLATEVQRLREALEASEQKVRSYHMLVSEMKDRTFAHAYQTVCCRQSSLARWTRVPRECGMGTRACCCRKRLSHTRSICDNHRICFRSGATWRASANP